MKQALLVALCAAFICLTAAAPGRAVISDSEELTRIGGLGSGAGQLKSLRGLASDPVTGHLFAVENENSRVSEFTPWGEFVKAFGFDVAPGPVDEEQEVRVRAAMGQFRVSFNGDATPDLPFNASAAQLEAALNALPSINAGGGDVTVEGVAGDPDGSVPYVHVITFKGSLGATNVAAVQAVDGTEPLSGGVPLTGHAVRTRADGTPGGTGLESCTEASGCQPGVAGDGAGQLSGPRGVTVDQAGNVYVKEVDNVRVQKFDAAGRFVWMIGGEVNTTTGADLCTDVSGDACGGGIAGVGSSEFSFGNIEGITFCPADPPAGLCPSGALFVADKDRLQRFSLDGTYETELPQPTKTVGAVAFDSADEDLYATYVNENGVHKIDGATGTEIPPVRQGSRLLAVGPAGELFTDDGIKIETAPGKLGEVRLVRQYGPTGSELSPSTCCAAELLPGSTLEENKRFALSGLGTNAAGNLHVANTQVGVDSFIRVFGPGPVEFEGPPPVPPTIAAQFASSVQSGGATVAALINPRFFTDAAYFVQFGTGQCVAGGCPNETPAPPAVLTTKAFGQPIRTAGVFLGGLQPGTTYHYRFVAKSGGGGPVFGSETTFTTPDLLPKPPCANDVFRGGASAKLPDCRAYEMVSPINKNNGDIKTLVDFIGFTTKLGQAATDGNKLTYSSSRSFGNPKGAPLTNQYLARRAWNSEAINAGQGPVDDLSLAANSYKAFSEDLCTGWFVSAAEPLLDPGRDFPGYRNVYRRDFCGGAPDEALLPVQPTVMPKEFNPEPQGASANGQAAIIRVKDKLDPDAASERWQTYYAKDGTLELLCYLPSGSPTGGHCSGGTGAGAASGLDPSDLNRFANVTNAISNDGSRVYWTDSGLKETGPGTVYLRINVGAPQSAGDCEAELACTVPVSGTKTPQPSRFLQATPDGAKALFEVTAGGLAENLYLFDAEASSSSLVAGEVIGLVAASEDLARIYLVSKEALAPGSTSGQPNLYLAEGDEMTFIALLSQADVAPSETPSNTSRIPIYHAPRTSTDGGELAFISTRSLTGYDNADLTTGMPNSEVYLYEVGSEDPICVSCNPSGARPQGKLVQLTGNVAGKLATASGLAMPDNMLHVPRALSEDGERLFFESFDALLPRDLNGAKDVYEWESAPSKVACQAVGAELYVAKAAGCISLISSGESPEDSEFLDASASGNDVFFITNAGLLPQDPGLFDVYDARVGGGLPFFQPLSECQGETCKPPATAPNDPTPASSTYVGPGDIKEKGKKKQKGKKGGKTGRAGR